MVTAAISAPMPSPEMKRKMISSVTLALSAASTVPIENTATEICKANLRPHLSAIVLSTKAPMM